MQKSELRILMVEDMPTDAELEMVGLLEEILERSGAPLEPISDEPCPPPSAMRVVICRKPERAREWTPLAGSWIAQAFAGAALAAATPG